jgi:predicted RNA polymerase sigma factor
MEFQASRFAARVNRDGSPVLLADQDRSRWDRTQISRGLTSLACADALGRGRGNYCLQAAIAQCHAIAGSFEETDWNKIVFHYEALGRLAPSPVVELNHAVAVSMATGPIAALKIADRLVTGGALRRSHLLPSIRGELLTKIGRTDEAKTELLQAAALTVNEQQKALLLAKAATL